MTGCDGFDRATGGPCARVATESTPGGQDLCLPCANEFWDRRAAIDEAYPDSDIPPGWFDPGYAGERWNPDD